MIPLFVLFTFAQEDPSFEVASVRPTPDKSVAVDFRTGNGRFLGRNITALLLTQIAYELEDFQIVGAPAWMRADGFDIDAKAPENSRGDLFGMARSLLRERFSLQAHMERQETSVFELVPANGGPKIKMSKDQSPGTGASGDLHFSSNKLAGTGVPMNLVVTLLSRKVRRPVVNRTGIDGRIDLQLEWSNISDDPDQPSIFTVIQERLGLRLRPGRAPADVLVIEHVKHPTPN